MLLCQLSVGVNTQCKADCNAFPLTGELREAASLYNACLEERIGAWRIDRKSINYYDQANQLKAMRVDGCLTLTNYS